MRRISLLATLLFSSAAPLRAQLPDWVGQILNAAMLPVATTNARQDGIGSDEIRAVLDAMRAANVPAYDAVALFDTVRAVRHDHGRADNFGAFVQTQLAAGKRGTELAAAIRAEHARQGKGSAARGGRGRGRGNAETKPDNRGRGRPPQTFNQK